MGNKHSKSSKNDGKPNKSLNPSKPKGREHSNYFDVVPNAGPNPKPTRVSGSNMFNPVMISWDHGAAAEAKIAAAEAEAEAKRVKKAEAQEHKRLEELCNLASADRRGIAETYKRELKNGVRNLYECDELNDEAISEFNSFFKTVKAQNKTDKNIADACQNILRLFVQKFLELVRASLTMDHTPITDNCVIDKIIDTYLTQHTVITDAVADAFILVVLKKTFL